MGYERYSRDTRPQSDYYGRRDPQEYGRDYGSGRDDNFSSARDDQRAAGYGDRDYGNQRYGQRDQQGEQPYGQRSDQRGFRGDAGRDEQRSSYASQGGRQHYGQSTEYHGSYASDGRRFEDVGRYAHADDDDYRQREGGRDRQFGDRSQGRDDQDRGFFQRAGDEVRSWFGDDEAERRREQDQRYANHRDGDYHKWRSDQIAALDRDYDEYRQENRSKFENEFSTWRTSRQGQRTLLSKVKEHLDVVGSDGEHVGTVDKVRGDRIVLTKSDADAGGRHHSIPSSWLQSVDDQVTLAKTAADAKQHWQNEERNQALFGDRNDADRDGQAGGRDQTATRTRATTY